MIIEALFIITPNWKLPSCPLADTWINNPWYINPEDYSSAIKRNKLLTHTVTQMHLSEKSRTKSLHIIQFYLHDNLVKENLQGKKINLWFSGLGW
jgi:hypothetical protein